MKTTVVAGLLAVFVTLTGCVARDVQVAGVAPSAAVAPPAADTLPGWMPPQEPLGGTPITPVESVGASPTD